ncbi:MAG: hypothetical protein KJ792_16070 [Actinobacteria bacterium]|nr:hypothetical protein [Actinomycetota bacterium]MCG2802344.1 hypothetical protein [Cellulomonas sp.]
MPSRLPYDIRAYHRLRWRARAATLVLGLPAVLLGARLVGQPSPFLFVSLSLYVIVAGWGVVTAWRTSYRARPHVLRDDDLPGARIGVPELDEAPRPHLGLHGDIDPPARW